MRLYGSFGLIWDNRGILGSDGHLKGCVSVQLWWIWGIGE